MTAIAPGDLKVVASCEGKSAALPISIQPPAIGGVRISGVPQVVYVKMPFRLVAIITDGWGKQIHRTVEWRSSNVSAVSIAPTGQATASALGHARISAVVEGVEGSVEIDVVEPPLPKTVVVPVLPPVARAISKAAPSEAAVLESVPLAEDPVLAASNAPTEPMGVPIVEPTSEPPAESQRLWTKRRRRVNRRRRSRFRVCSPQRRCSRPRSGHRPHCRRERADDAPTSPLVPPSLR